MSDNESTTSRSSQSSANSKTSSRRRSNSRCNSRNSSNGSATNLDWIILSQFDEVANGIEFVNTVIARYVFI